MKRKLFFAYGVACHAMFFGVYAWMAAFVGGFDFGGRVRAIDGPRVGSVWTALWVDVLLIAVFGVQHSVMARPGFKRWWTRFVPAPIERATYVLIANVLMVALMGWWRPVGGVVWDVREPASARWALHGLFAVGWLMVPAVSFMIDHFDLFGTRQVWMYLRGRTAKAEQLRTPGAYRFVRHPLYVGWLIAFWASPTMTVTHLVFAVGMTVYILIAIPLEERDLVAQYGEAYEKYRRQVGGLVPRAGSRQANSGVEEAVARW